MSLGPVPAVISPYVVRAMGMRQARRYMLSAEPFDAITARRLNAAHRLSKPAQLLSEGAGLWECALCRNGPGGDEGDQAAAGRHREHQPGRQHEEKPSRPSPGRGLDSRPRRGSRPSSTSAPTWRPCFKDEA